MRTADFDYELPQSHIAQAPSIPRDACKLMVLDRKTGAIEHAIFRDIDQFLEPGDLLVANKTRVMPARLIGKKHGTGGVAEVFLLRRREDLDALGSIWECLVNPGKRLKPGAHIDFRAGGLHAADAAEVILEAEVLDFCSSKGGRLVKFSSAENLSLDEAIHQVGHVPLPPYVTEYEGDPERYQTVYAMKEEHSAAAPTAGLHFTDELLNKLQKQGIEFATVELEVGIDTFRLVEEDNPADHVMHTERYHLDASVVEAIRKTRERKGRVIAVGTTSVRSLESAWDPEAVDNGTARAGEKGAVVERIQATTDLFLMPGSSFHVVDAMITNFHVPRSSLMMLVSAFASRDIIMEAYKEAIASDYKMLSFGDAMFMH